MCWYLPPDWLALTCSPIFVFVVAVSSWLYDCMTLRWTYRLPIAPSPRLPAVLVLTHAVLVQCLHTAVLSCFALKLSLVCCCLALIRFSAAYERLRERLNSEREPSCIFCWSSSV